MALKLLICLLFSVCNAFVAGVTCGITPIDIRTPYTIATNLPSFSQRNHTLQPTSIWGSLHAPHPTGSFFTNIGLGANYFPIAPYPYHIKIDNVGGVSISYATWRGTTSSYVIIPFTADLIIGGVESTQQFISGYDQLSLTMTWNQVAGSGSMNSPIVRGSPYITMEYSNLTPIIQSSHAILSVNGNWGSGPFNGTNFVITMNNGMTWKIYSLNGQSITFNKLNNALQASSKFNGVLRTVVILNDTDIPVLDASSETYPIGGDISYAFNSDTASLNFVWQTRGPCPSSVLIMALPHHTDSIVLNNFTAVTSLQYRMIKGYMTGIVGNNWSLKENLTPIQWYSPAGIDPSKKSAVVAALQQEKNRRCTVGDSYNAGKILASMGRMALIADEIGDSVTATLIRQNMIADMDPWLLGTNWDALLYEPLWGGICSTSGLADENADYGQGWYNDHHFHYGYFLYAAAVIGKGNSAWIQSRKEQLIDIVRDIANPNTNDPYFPTTRHKDWFDGHSWASGLFPFGDSKNQESTSESVNAYYGLYLLGEALQDTQLSNWGRLLLATEIRSVQKYWHIPSTSDIYDSPFSDNKMVGVLWSSKVDYATFFGGNVEYIHCIQMLPFTPITEELLPASFIQEEYPVVSAVLTQANYTVADGWKGFIFMDHAIIEKETAWSEVQTLGWYDNGNSQTNTLYWVATRPSNTKKRMSIN